LKWPNDVWVDQRKLAGILVEVVADRRHCNALIGIGLNLDLPATAAAAIDQPWIDLKQLLDPPPARKLLIAALLRQLHADLSRFDASGLESFHADWRRADALAGRAIWLLEAGGPTAAHALGIDAIGRLVVDVGGQQRKLSAGEISIRLNE